MNRSESIANLAEALAASQVEMQNVTKTREGKISGQTKRGNDFEYSYDYADIADALKVARPILGKNGLSIVQRTDIDGGTMVLETCLLHSSGEWISGRYPVCAIGGRHQEMGGALTYARRYALMAMIGLAAEAEDNDGADAADPKPPKKQKPHIDEQPTLPQDDVNKAAMEWCRGQVSKNPHDPAFLQKVINAYSEKCKAKGIAEDPKCLSYLEGAYHAAKNAEQSAKLGTPVDPPLKQLQDRLNTDMVNFEQAATWWADLKPVLTDDEFATGVSLIEGAKA